MRDKNTFEKLAVKIKIVVQYKKNDININLK